MIERERVRRDSVCESARGSLSNFMCSHRAQLQVTTRLFCLLTSPVLTSLVLISLVLSLWCPAPGCRASLFWFDQSCFDQSCLLRFKVPVAPGSRGVRAESNWPVPSCLTSFLGPVPSIELIASLSLSLALSLSLSPPSPPPLSRSLSLSLITGVPRS